MDQLGSVFSGYPNQIDEAIDESISIYKISLLVSIGIGQMWMTNRLHTKAVYQLILTGKINCTQTSQFFLTEFQLSLSLQNRRNFLRILGE